MRYLFYEHGELVAELDKCTVVSAADDAGVSTVLFNGKTYQRRKPVEFVQEWVAFDLVNKWASAPFQSFEEVNKAAAGWFDKLPKKLPSETADRYAECRKERMQFQDRLGACSRALGSWLLPNGDIPQSIAKLVEQVNASRAYHANDGVGEDSPASTSSVKYFRGQIARLRDDKIVANGLIANLEGLAAADGEKIRDLESRLETVAASRERSIDDYNKSVAREGRLREEIQRLNLRLADAEHERVRLRKQLEGQREIAGVENGQLRRALADAMEKLYTMAATAAPSIVISRSDYGAALRAEVERLSTEVIELTKQRDKAIAAHENAEYGAELLANANEGLTRSLDEMAKSLRAKSKECADRTEALNEARIDESRSTQNAERYQRKLYEIDQIIKK